MVLLGPFFVVKCSLLYMQTENTRHTYLKHLDLVKTYLDYNQQCVAYMYIHMFL